MLIWGLSMKTIPGTKFTFPCSPILLFRFNEGLDGQIDKQEFLRLYKVRRMKAGRKKKMKNVRLSISPPPLLFSLSSFF
jgi:hypothetical protein